MNKKTETKSDPPRTNEGDHDQGRVRVDTVVTTGPDGIQRLKTLMARVLNAAKVLILFI